MEVTVYKEYKTSLRSEYLPEFIIGLKKYLNEHFEKCDSVEIAQKFIAFKKMYDIKIKVMNTYKVDTDADIEDYFKRDRFHIYCKFPRISEYYGVDFACKCTKSKVFIMD